ADLKGRPLVVEIAAAPTETFKTSSGGEDRKTVLHFHGGRVKSLPLNMTNWDAVAEIAGDDTDRWRGTRVGGFPTTTEMEGESVDCIRIRQPAQREFARPRMTGHCRRLLRATAGVPATTTISPLSGDRQCSTPPCASRKRVWRCFHAGRATSGRPRPMA